MFRKISSVGTFVLTIGMQTVNGAAEQLEERESPVVLMACSDINGKPRVTHNLKRYFKGEGPHKLGLVVNGAFSERGGISNYATLKHLGQLGQRTQIAVSLGESDMGRIPLHGGEYGCRIDGRYLGRVLREKGIEVVDAHTDVIGTPDGHLNFRHEDEAYRVEFHATIRDVFVTGLAPSDMWTIGRDHQTPIQNLRRVLDDAFKARVRQVLIALHEVPEIAEEMIELTLRTLEPTCPVSVLCPRNPETDKLSYYRLLGVHYAIPGRNGLAFLTSDGQWLSEADYQKRLP